VPSLRRPANGRLLLPLLALLLAACGRSEPEGRFVVVQREFTWGPVAGASAAPAERQPLSHSWTFDGPLNGWTVTAGSARAGSGAGPGSGPGGGSLVIEGTGEVGIAGPGRSEFPDELFHWISIRLATSTAHSLALSWQGGLPHTVAVQGTGEPETVTVPLDALASVRHTPGSPLLSVVAAGEPDQPVAIRLDSIHLVSDFESAGNAGFVLARLRRAGRLRSGVALRTPGEVELQVPCAAGDRLRFALALVGGGKPVDVVLSEAQGRIPEQRWTCAAGGNWLPCAIPLPAAPADGALTLVFRAQAPSSSTSVLLIGSPMLLRRTTGPAPQVVLYVEDTLRADHLQTLGYERPTDPHLQAMARDGAIFARTWSSSCWTRPAVSSLLTGLDPVGHANRMVQWRVADELVTLPEALAGAGCVTASFVTNHHGGSWSGLDQGFDVQGEPEAFDSDALTSTLTSSLISGPIEMFLAEHRDEAFFVYAHSLDPHAPYEADPESLRELGGVPVPETPELSPGEPDQRHDSLTQYDGEIRHNDREIDALDNALKTTGLQADTLFVFVADHGEAFFEHGQWEHRRSLHEEEVRVPWVLRWPGRVPPATRLDFPASLEDVAPTILGLLELPVPPTWRGRDLSRLCLDPRARLPVGPLFLDILDAVPTAARAGEVALVAWPDKLIAVTGPDGSLTPSSLYRLDTDPRELRDLLPEADPAHLGALLDELRKHADAGSVSPAADSRAADVSPELEAWMRQMGYLR